MKNYFIDEGIRYEVSDNPTSEELGEHQDRSYSRTETLVNKVFEVDEKL